MALKIYVHKIVRDERTISINGLDAGRLELITSPYRIVVRHETITVDGRRETYREFLDHRRPAMNPSLGYLLPSGCPELALLDGMDLTLIGPYDIRAYVSSLYLDFNGLKVFGEQDNWTARQFAMPSFSAWTF